MRLILLCLMLVTPLCAPAMAQDAKRPAAPPRPELVLPPADQPSPWDVYLTVFSSPGAPDQIGLSYDVAPEDEVIKKDVIELARSLNQPPPEVSITRDHDIAAASFSMSGLTNWETGIVALDAVTRAFQRFDRFHISCVFLGEFPLKSTESLQRGRLSVETRVSGSTVEYDITIAPGQGGELPSINSPGSETGPNRLLWLVVAGIVILALLAAGAVYLTGRKRPS